MVHAIASRANIILQLNFSTRIPYDRPHTMNILSYRARVPILEEIRVEDSARRIRLQHLQKSGQRVAHIMMVPEHLAAVAIPNVFPDILWIRSHRVD